MAFLGDFGKLLGNIGKGLGGIATGAISGFLGTGGSPWGALLGGVGGLFSGKESDRIGTYIPPTIQEAYNIVKNLEGQVGNIANLQYSIQAPFVNEAYNIFKTTPFTYDTLFKEAERNISDKYNSLFSNVFQQMNNQWSKSALGLSALGMYNSPATQLTQSDIVNQLYGKVAEAQTKDLVGLDKDKLNAFLNYYDKAPQVLTSFSDIFTSINPEINKFDLQQKLAGLLNGLSSNVTIYPKSTPLQQISSSLNNYIKNSQQDLPDFGQTMSSIFSKIKGIFS
jgi:hypothetical protein